MSFKLKSTALIVIALCVLAGLAWKFAHTPVKKAEGYNIVFISMDTTRADFIGAYGNTNIATPNIDRLAAEGVLFERYNSPINTTLAAHSSMFTGLYPRNHGVGRNSMRLNSKNLTMAELLHAKGYNTGAFIGSFALASVFGFEQGFQTFEESFIGNPADFIERNVHSRTAQKMDFESIIPKTNVGHIMRSAEDVNKAFFGWLDAQKKDQKFFAFVHYYDPHFPYEPPEKWYKKRMVAIPKEVPMTQETRAPLEAIFRDYLDRTAKFRPSELREMYMHEVPKAMIDLYSGEIEYTDWAIGEIMKKLEQKGLDSKTIIVLTADHGENMVEHWEFNSFFRHGYLTHQTETHVPMIIRAPGVLPEGHRVKANASHVDIFPTLMELMNLTAPKNLDGTSLLTKLFFRGKDLNRMIFSEASQPHVNLQRDARKMVWVNDNNSASVHGDKWKYISIPNKSIEAFFDLEKDPYEENNLLQKILTDDPERLDAYRAALKTWRSKALSGNVDSAFELSEEDREKLESLGYVDK